jgi:hypothetical protein
LLLVVVVNRTRARHYGAVITELQVLLPAARARFVAQEPVDDAFSVEEVLASAIVAPANRIAVNILLEAYRASLCFVVHLLIVFGMIRIATTRRRIDVPAFRIVLGSVYALVKEGPITLRLGIALVCQVPVLDQDLFKVSTPLLGRAWRDTKP